MRYRARQWRRRRLGIGHIANVVEPDGSAVAIGAGAPSGGEPSEEPVPTGGLGAGLGGELPDRGRSVDGGVSSVSSSEVPEKLKSRWLKMGLVDKHGNPL